jgi:hypothetical protein
VHVAGSDPDRHALTDLGKLLGYHACDEPRAGRVEMDEGLASGGLDDHNLAFDLALFQPDMLGANSDLAVASEPEPRGRLRGKEVHRRTADERGDEAVDRAAIDVVGRPDLRDEPALEHGYPVAEQVGYPLYMKPFDGGMWVGVTRIESSEELHRSYDESGERLMHLQAAVDDFEVFTRSLSIGPQTKVTQYDPSADGHYRYIVGDDFLAPELMREVETIGRLVNAFFRWELNSCEVIVKGGEAYPIDYANASPDMALVSLHYYFPWAIQALAAWCMFCTATDRKVGVYQPTRDYFEIGDDGSLSYEDKLERYRALADDYFQTEAFEEFRAEALPQLDETMVEYVESPELDELIVEIIQTEEPEEKQERLIERSRTAVAAWASDRRAARV